jgi:leucyl-tRNA synthetase
VWRLVADEDGNLAHSLLDLELTTEQEYVLHSTIKKVGEDIENLRFNTAISQMMIFVNEFTKVTMKPKKAVSDFILCLAPFAPHIAEELWQKLGNKSSVVNQPFPQFNEVKTRKNQVEMIVQVVSKIRAKLLIEPGLTQDEVQALALADEKVQRHMEGKPIKKVIFVKDKIINFIV